MRKGDWGFRAHQVPNSEARAISVSVSRAGHVPPFTLLRLPRTK